MMRYNGLRGTPVAMAAVALLAMTLAAGTADAGKRNKKEKAKKAERGYIGVYMQELTRDVRKGLDLDVRDGVLINRVEDDSPAEKAGIEAGDVIIEFDGHSVGDPDDLSNLVKDLKPGDKVEVAVNRDGEKKKMTIEIAERPDEWAWYSNDDDNDFGFNIDLDRLRHGAARFMPGPRLGVRASELNDDLAGYFDTKAGKGVLVLDVIDDSIAEEAGVKAGDVITDVNGERIKEIGDIGDAIEELEPEETFVVTVLRKGKSMKLDATMDDNARIGMFRDGRRGGNFVFDTNRFRRHGNAPRVRVEQFDRQDNSDIREELDQLRKELKDLRKELKKDKG